MSNTLTKAAIVERLIKENKLPKSHARQFVDDFFELMRNVLEGGQHLKLSGFGNFCLRDKRERPGRNPKTGQEVTIEARRVVTFRPGQKLRARIKERRPE